MSYRDWLVEVLLLHIFTSSRAWYVRLCAWVLSFFFGRVDSSWLLNNDHGTWIGRDIKHDSEEALINRLNKSDAVIIWVQGGGFRCHLGQLYQATFVRLIELLAKKKMTCTILVAKYSLAAFPAPMNDLVKVHEWLTNALDVAPSKIVWGGDSSGAALVLDTLYQRELGRDARSVVLSSPYLGLDPGGKGWQEHIAEDRLSDKGIEAMERAYAPGLQNEDGYEDADEEPFMFLHAKADLTRLPRRILFQTGEHEVLQDDAAWLKEKIEKGHKNAQITLATAKGRRHLDTMLIGTDEDLAPWVEFITT
ncbi:Alpha/Beta hydrolase protein [Gongronella butleri]|nr:Alpha/Beta hydrolase protein [Gongronella butleri]